MSHYLNSHPNENEYAPYYGRYISLVPEGDFFLLLNKQFDATLEFLRNLTETQVGTRYEPGKWSIKEVLGHVIDTERIMSYRALRIGRADETPIPGFEQDDYVRAANFDSRTWDDLLAEFQIVRAATVALLRGLDEKAFGRRGTASNLSVTVRALAYIIAGHERHHLNVLRTKYLPVLK
ncbi:MAG: DinB family protein [bacterium]